ncbi:hypothetical protein J2X43_003940 [Rhizobium sp. BE258]|jgi:hypothetical protein|nr:hypothetical protein [Rhizobium sp. BE258]
MKNTASPGASITPLCPAGHLPHKGGDRLGAAARSPLIIWLSRRNRSISPLVGEMSGRTEGGVQREKANETIASPVREPVQ